MKIAVPKNADPNFRPKLRKCGTCGRRMDYHAASEVYVPHLLSRSVPCGAEPQAAGRRDPSGR